MIILFYCILFNIWIGGAVYVFNQKLSGLEAIGDLVMSLLLWPSILFGRLLLKTFGDINEK